MKEKKANGLYIFFKIFITEILLLIIFSTLVKFFKINFTSIQFEVYSSLYLFIFVLIIYLFLPEGKFKKYFTKIGIFLLLIFAISVFPLVPIAVFNLKTDTWSQTTKVLFQLTSDITVMLFIYFLYRKIVNKNFVDYFKNFKDNFEESFKYYLIGLVIMIASNVIINVFITNGIAGNEEEVRNLINTYPLYMIFSVAIYAPFTEEMIFRKSIKDIFLVDKDNKITKYLYIITSGLIFGGMHIIGTYKSPVDLLYLIPYGALGTVFAANYHKTNNIFSTITMHCMHNTITLLLYFSIGGI